jgi:hypothetical protein
MSYARKQDNREFLSTMTTTWLSQVVKTPCGAPFEAR